MFQKTKINFGKIVFVGCFILFVLLSSHVASAAEIRQTNIRDAQFTVSWATAKKVSGRVNYGATSALGSTAVDDRGGATLDTLHHITIKNLKPNTLYYYEVVSGDTTDNSNGNYYTCKTGNTFVPVGSDLVYGKIVNTNRTPYSKGAIVYLELKDANGYGNSGTSSLISVLLEPNGYWSTELTNAREAGAGKSYGYSKVGDKLAIEVITSGGEVSLLEVDTANDSPAKDIKVSK